MTSSFECVVIGAGVVGLATARALARSGREVLLLERERSFGAGNSSRNSEVIHAGFYYAPGSLKARLCVEGRRQLYEYCDSRGIAHRRCGKLVVATTEEEERALVGLHERGLVNDVEQLAMLSAAQVHARAPQLSCRAALESGSTGIVDSHELMSALAADLEAAGGTIAWRTALRAARIDDTGRFVLETEVPDGALHCRELVNSAGLDATRLAHELDGFPRSHVPELRLAKGSYFALRGRPPFSTLVYPLPPVGGLGIHLTLDLAGHARFGPDVEWVTEVDYSVSTERAPLFDAAIRRYWPTLPEDALEPAYAGIRPKIFVANEPYADFLIQGPRDHGIPGLVNLFGIESPGITASLALGQHVTRLLV